MVFFCALGVAFFCYVSVGSSTELGWAWRVAYGARAPLYLMGMLQALERLVRPEQAAARSGTLTEGVKLGILIGRWLTIAVSLGGFVVVSVVSFFVQGDAEDVCDDLKLLILSMILLCFCLADLAGETTFSQAMWTNAWQRGAKDGSGGLAKRRISWHSLYQGRR